MTNISNLRQNPRFEFIRHDVVLPINLEIDQIYHLACPASPPAYQKNGIKTIKTNIIGTLNMLGLAKRVGARILLSSTSEIYGDPLVSPQSESYWGNVNPIGPRSCYDEGKRCAETLMSEYYRHHGVNIRIARIFNTYGPKMNPTDGRVVSNFINQVLNKKAMTIYGTGKQTRSFCYVSDTVAGLMALMNMKDYVGPVNIGNPNEITICMLAEKIKTLMGSDVGIIYHKKPTDDPMKRCPDITKAKKYLNWTPTVRLDVGLLKTIDYYRRLHTLMC